MLRARGITLNANNPQRSTMARLAVLCAVVLALNACGGNGDSAAPPSVNAPPAPPPPVTAPPPPPHTVGNCAQLPQPGVWEEISPVPGNGPPAGAAGEGLKWGAARVLAHPAHSGTVYVSVLNHGIWKSTDCGSTWAKTNTGRNGALLDFGTQFSMHMVATTAGDVLYVNNFQGLGGTLRMLVSKNGGVDWSLLYGDDVAKQVEFDGYGGDLSIDPADPQHLMVNFHANCIAPNVGGCLAESADGGTSWHIVPGPLGHWAEGARAYILTRTNWLHASHEGLWLTTNSGQKWTLVAQSGSDGGILDTQGVMYLPSDQGMLRSTDRGLAWSVMAGSPPTSSLVGTGTTIYTGFVFSSGTQVLSQASQANPTTWTRITGPQMGTNGGPWGLDYDHDHRVLYSAHHRSGLWRTVTP